MSGSKQNCPALKHQNSNELGNCRLRAVVHLNRTRFWLAISGHKCPEVDRCDDPVGIRGIAPSFGVLSMYELSCPSKRYIWPKNATVARNGICVGLMFACEASGTGRSVQVGHGDRPVARPAHATQKKIERFGNKKVAGSLLLHGG